MKDLLKFITCGSVDDGKSTLIGHMLYDAKLLFADQKRALELDSKVGSAGGDVDYSLLLDGLMAEREQGITIDVAYRYFSTELRSFIVADTPGHEEYTRNMAVGASFADAAVILIDATKGVLTQTRRHTRICALMGIRDFIFAVNKMDLVGFDCKVYETVKAQVEELAADYVVNSLTVIPVSATNGDNLTENSANTPWYTGVPLLHYLENLEPWTQPEEDGFCMPVQRVSRPDRTFRGFQGEVTTGYICTGDEITVLPSRETAHVSEILAAGKQTQKACRGEPVTLCLDREIDVSRGCVITKDKSLITARKFAALLLWMDETPLFAGGQFIMRLGTQKVPVTVTHLCYRIDVNSGEHIKDTKVVKNGIALCELAADLPFVFDTFQNTRELGELILIDRMSHATAACGTVQYPLDQQGSAIEQQTTITRKMREDHNGHRAVTVWLTGLSGAGKSQMADALEKLLFADGVHTMILDGDNIRRGLCRDLGFSPDDRKENIRRVAEMAKVLNDAGVLVLTAFISPFAADRQMAREIIGESFVEVYVNTSLTVCEERDVKGLYAKARRGEIREFTGISSPYEPPEHPEYTIDTSKGSVQENAQKLLHGLKKYVAAE
ncbi:MAG: adenylyl-sulfate kinase [Clostridia bacterium]|nr:adenylyl-sulfate kinase [Clostridia bacterium]